MTAARILLADDHAMVRSGLRLILDAEPDLAVVAEAGDGHEAVKAGLEQDVDLAILDVSMPSMSGLEAAAELNRQRPSLPILMLSVHESDQYLFEALRVRASGYVLKSAADQDLVAACRAALRGEPALYSSAIASIVRDFVERARAGEEAPQDPLTPRELEILKLIAQAHTSHAIALRLGISPKTVDRHRQNILGKLGMRDRVELTRYAIRRGLIEP